MKTKIKIFVVFLIVLLSSPTVHAAGFMDTWKSMKQGMMKKVLHYGKARPQVAKPSQGMLDFTKYGCWDTDDEGLSGPYKTPGQILYKKHLGVDDNGEDLFKTEVVTEVVIDKCDDDNIIEYHCDYFKQNPGYWKQTQLRNAKKQISTTKPCPINTTCKQGTCQLNCNDIDGENFEVKAYVVEYKYDGEMAVPKSPVFDKCSQNSGWLEEQVCSSDGKLTTKLKHCKDFGQNHTCFEGNCAECEGEDLDLDGISSGCDNCLDASNSDQADTDNDGIGDACDNCAFAPNIGQLDADFDGMGDLCDNCPNGDEDFDGICDIDDNCPSIANNDQVDQDGDNMGAACDPCDLENDKDNDSICDEADNCIEDANTDQSDSDNDKVGDVCDYCPGDIDSDEDGLCNLNDNCQFVTNPEQEDPNNNGIGTVCDCDEDGDGILDIEITDTTLKNYIHALLLKPLDQDITTTDAQNIKEIEFVGNSTDMPGLMKVKSLNGLQCFTELTKLDLPSNNISNLGPIANLIKLKEIALYGNKITDITALKDLSQLEYVNLFKNNISNITALANKPYLTDLILAGNEIENLYPLVNLPSIKILYLDNNMIQDVTPIANFNSLTDLNLTSNDIGNIDPLQPLINLQALLLSNNNISNINVVANLTNLTNLQMSYNKCANGNCTLNLSPISNLSKLQKFSAESNNINNIEPLSNKLELEVLMISSNPISNFAPLSDATKLKGLYMQDCNAFDINFLSQLKMLNSLYIGRNNLQDTVGEEPILQPLAQLPELRTISLFGGLPPSMDNKIYYLDPLQTLQKLQYIEFFVSYLKPPYLQPLIDNTDFATYVPGPCMHVLLLEATHYIEEIEGINAEIIKAQAKELCSSGVFVSGEWCAD